jgi:hypothetical protein
MIKKNISKVIVLISSLKDLIKARKMILRPSIDDIDLNGLSTLNILKAVKLAPPIYEKASQPVISIIKSKIFQASFK